MFNSARRFISPAVLAAATLFGGPSALAQTGTGTIAGTVTQASTSAPVANAQIRVVSAAGIETTVASNPDGTYRVAGLAPGSYFVSARGIGFRESVAVRIDVAADQTVQHVIELTGNAPALEEIVITASRAPEKVIDAPASVSVVGREEIEARPALSPTDHLRAVPGVDIIKGGLVQANIAARGFNGAFSGSLLMLQDNRFATVPSLRVNVPFLLTSTNEDIERIEVVLGPAAALYGPGSANGVLHVITKSPFNSQGTTLTMDLGERSTRRGAFRHAGNVGQMFGYKLSFEKTVGDEWRNTDAAEPASVPRPPSNGAPRVMTPVSRDFDVSRTAGEARIDIRPAPNTEIIGSYGFADIGSALELTSTSGVAQVRNWKYQHFQSRFRSGRFFVQAFLNLSDSGNEDSLDTRGTFLLRTGAPIVDRSNLFATQFQHSFESVSRGFRLIYGGDLIQTNPKTSGTVHGRNEGTDKVSETGAYVHATQRLWERFELLGALRVDNHSKLEGNFVSPRAALVFKPTETQNIRLTYNRAFNNPATFQFSIDLAQARLGPLPYTIRVLGNETGYAFRRDCAGGTSGLCMKSPFTPAGAGGPAQFLPANAAAMWQAALTVASGQLPASLMPLLRSLNPTATQIATTLRTFNPGRQPTPGFNTTSFDPADVTDLDPLKVTRNEVIELGYKGNLTDRFSVGLDLWYQRRFDVRTTALATPNVFLDQASMTTYLTGVFTAAGLGPAAGPTAAAVAGGLTQVPLGTVTPNHPLANNGDLLFIYRNVPGTTSVRGADLAFDFGFTEKVSLLGTYSWVSDVLFPTPPGVEQITLNAADNKASLTARYNDRDRGLKAELRGRYVNAFPVNDGVWVGRVPVNAMLDAGFSIGMPGTGGHGLFSLNAINLLDNQRRSYVGVPEIGRMVMSRIQYTF
ncbi:MAG TPA: TonB-dependent receptor [Gemmatimonadaceae bacterium]|nr:TonB-dependent receptor [Gemmatimonadaceae bacterium]